MPFFIVKMEDTPDSVDARAFFRAAERAEDTPRFLPSAPVPDGVTPEVSIAMDIPGECEAGLSAGAQTRALVRTALRLAAGCRCRTILFDITGDEADCADAEAIRACMPDIGSFAAESDMTIYLAVRSPEAYREAVFRAQGAPFLLPQDTVPHSLLGQSLPQHAAAPLSPGSAFYDQLGIYRLHMHVENRPETFSQKLLRLIEESGMTSAQCYRKANIDRRTFSKLKADPDYAPRKSTVIGFAMALELDEEGTRKLLESAGFAFSESIAFDIIVRYCIAAGMHDVYAVNEILFAFGQKLIGS